MEDRKKELEELYLMREKHQLKGWSLNPTEVYWKGGYFDRSWIDETIKKIEKELNINMGVQK